MLKYLSRNTRNSKTLMKKKLRSNHDIHEELNLSIHWNFCSTGGDGRNFLANFWSVWSHEEAVTFLTLICETHSNGIFASHFVQFSTVLDITGTLLISSTNPLSPWTNTRGWKYALILFCRLSGKLFPVCTKFCESCFWITSNLVLHFCPAVSYYFLVQHWCRHIWNKLTLSSIVLAVLSV